jgi:hypothetical protein
MTPSSISESSVRAGTLSTVSRSSLTPSSSLAIQWTPLLEGLTTRSSSAIVFEAAICSACERPSSPLSRRFSRRVRKFAGSGSSASASANGCPTSAQTVVLPMFAPTSMNVRPAMASVPYRPCTLMTLRPRTLMSPRPCFMNSARLMCWSSVRTSSCALLPAIGVQRYSVNGAAFSKKRPRTSGSSARRTARTGAAAASCSLPASEGRP